MSDFAKKLQATLEGVGGRYETVLRDLRQRIVEASDGIQAISAGKLRLELRPHDGNASYSRADGMPLPEGEPVGRWFQLVLHQYKPSAEVTRFGILFVSAGDPPIQLHDKTSSVRNFESVDNFGAWLDEMAGNPDSPLVRSIAMWRLNNPQEAAVAG